ncbi:hypothetical protein F503_02441 [Ophiostoma piceae UAMH 11346]|uniref:Uncharacterized protein n=1 Tax=Ophiostoma piceae (strain UAMH 11346) TaxID=1262450 RepID=S3CIU1_OPHP1|nr:hypothetical protein F503_02441 [Ophiostoma piceae UAMH 11346]
MATAEYKDAGLTDGRSDVDDSAGQQTQTRHRALELSELLLRSLGAATVRFQQLALQLQVVLCENTARPRGGKSKHGGRGDRAINESLGRSRP